jgi:hypothetical protein
MGYYLQSIIRPFDGTYSVTIKIVFQPEGSNFFDIIKAVKIDVIQRKSAMILPQDDERGTEGIFLNIKSSGNTLNKTSFAGSQLTYEKENVSFLSYFPQVATKKLSLFRAMRI